MTSLAASSSFKPENQWGYVSKLIHLRQVTFISGFKRAKPLIKAVDIGLALLVVGVAIGCYLLSNTILRELNSPRIVESGINTGALLNSIPALVCAVIFTLTMVTSFRVLLQALYLARDMDFLVAAPIPIRAVFLTKLLEAVLPSFILVLVFGLPVLLSLGTESEFHIVYYPLVLIVLVCIALAAAGISSLLVMAVVRIFPAKRVAEVLTFLGALLIITLSQAFNFYGRRLETLSPEQVFDGSQRLSSLNNPWFPLAWGGRSLVSMGQGNWLSGLFFLALMVGLSGIVFWLALNTAERLYYSGWASLQKGTQRKKNHRAAGRQDESVLSTSILQRLLPPEAGAILVKDFKLIGRDLNNLSQVIGALIVGIVFGVMLLRAGGEPPPAGRGEAPALFITIIRSVMVYGSMVIGLFVGWSMLSRLALVAFSMEGRSYWLLKTAPVSAGKLLAAKFLMAYIPALILGWLYLMGIALLQKPPLTTILYGLPAIALILAGLCGINLAFGVRGVNLTWTDPRKMENSVAGVLGMIISIVYQLVTLVLFFGPPLGFPLIGISEEIGMLAGLLAGGTVTLLCTFLPLKMIYGRVSRIGDE